MKRILIVDDDAFFLESMLRMFHTLDEDWTVVTATNGREALETVARSAFDVVVTDLIMPEKEGLDTIMELHKTRPKLPVIAMSGGGKYGIDCLPAAKSFGARYALRKPFAFEELVRCLRAILQPNQADKSPGSPA